MDKEGGSTQGSSEIVDIFDADRAAGNLNAVSTFPEKRLVKVYPIKWFQDMKFADCAGPGLRLFEFFSLYFSELLGHATGLGDGWDFPKEKLDDDFDLSGIPMPKANLTHKRDANGAKFRSGSSCSNPKPLYTRDERKEQKVAHEKRLAELRASAAARAQRSAAEDAKCSANKLLNCAKCPARFLTQGGLHRHVCGAQRIARAQRRLELQRCSVEAKLLPMDDDELAEAHRRAGSTDGRLVVQLESGTPGWALQEILGDGHTAPLECAELDWNPVCQIQPHHSQTCAAHHYRASLFATGRICVGDFCWPACSNPSHTLFR